MDFKYYNCDGCHEPFQENDDIITCPECGTPQHRSCYDAAGGCVNKDKHGTDFEWNQQSSFKEEDAETREKMVQMQTEDRATQSIKDSISRGEMPEVDDIIEQRINAVCPGITDEQRKEQVCGHDIGLTSAFVGNNVSKYIGKFRKMEQLNGRTFNWAAFLFSPYWFFWRKLYKPGIIFATLTICADIFMFRLMQPLQSIIETYMTSGMEALTEQDLLDMTSTMIPMYIIAIVTLIVKLIIGFKADKMYRNYTKRTLDQFVENRRVMENDQLLNFFMRKSSTNLTLTMLCLLAVQFIPELVINLFG